MEDIKKLCAWLRSYPGLESLTVDTVAAAPGSCGLFPGGVEQIKRRENLLGSVTVSCRQKFTLRRAAVRGEDAAAWLLAFQQWIARQQDAPVFGDGQSILRAEKGKLASVNQTGIGVYEVMLTAEYIKIYEEAE